MGIFGTAASLFADISLLIEAAILASFIVGWRYAIRKQTNDHYRIMTGAFLLNVAFVGSYMIRSLLTEGSTGFSGSSKTSYTFRQLSSMALRRYWPLVSQGSQCIMATLARFRQREGHFQNPY
jgi:uncharacterized membrane protein YozB (DUF420 family)